MNKLVSIIVPVYNVEEYLPKCLSSIENQTYKNLEIIAVNDGSTDHCGDILDRAAGGDTRYIIVRQENQGPISARNRGLELASGAYVAFVDSDDYIMPTMIEELVSGMETAQADLSIVRAVNDEKDASAHGALQELTSEETLRGMFSGSRSLRVTIWNKLYKRELIGNLRLEEGSELAEDILFETRYMSRMEKAVFIDASLYIYVHREGSILHGGCKEQQVIRKPIVDYKISREVISSFPQLESMMLVWAVSDCILWKRRLQNYGAIRRFTRNSSKLRVNIWRARELHWKTKILFAFGVI